MSYVTKVYVVTNAIKGIRQIFSNRAGAIECLKKAGFRVGQGVMTLHLTITV